MHLLGVGTVKVDSVAGWDTFAEVRLERLDTHINKSLQLRLIPFASLRVGEVDRFVPEAVLLVSSDRVGVMIVSEEEVADTVSATGY